MCLCNFKLRETFVIKFYFQIIIPHWRTTLGLFWVLEHRSVTAATISHIQLSCCNMKISWLWHMQKQSRILLPNPIRAGHKGIISERGRIFFLQIKANFVWWSQPRRYLEVKLPGFSIIMSRDWEGIILQFKARMEVKHVPDCFICMILHSHLYLRYLSERTLPQCILLMSVVILSVIFPSLTRLPLLFPSLCVPSSTSVFLIIFHIFRFTGLLDECINVEVALADMPVVFTHTKHYLSKILWQVWCTIHDSVPPFVLMVCWQGIHPLDICPVCSLKCFIFSIMVPPTSKSENWTPLSMNRVLNIWNDLRNEVFNLQRNFDYKPLIM